ncbi:META domain-containing protein [Cardiobacteriaceae bacterium TAE3-ERU3]|nr:META domain-containing protein [Cardiobacteriaceae bacterium TAE3-ERU3]
MKASILTGLAFSALLLGACAGESADSLSVESETWVLVEGQVDGQPLDLSNGEITLSFVDGEAMVGNGSVNKYRAPVAISGGSIKHTGPLITTRMAGPIPAMKLESEYLSALGEAESLQRSGNNLVITGEGDELHFTLKL